MAARHFCYPLLASLALTFGHGAASAQELPKVADPIPAQPVAAALNAFSRQTGLQVVYMSRVADGVSSSAIPGGLPSEEALRRLLEATGLEFEFLNNRTVTIAARGEDSKAAAKHPSSPISATTGTNGYTRLAQAEATSSSSSESTAPVGTGHSSNQERTELEEIIVTGTNIRGVYPASSPVQVYTAEDIARTGATTTEQFIQKLPQNMGTRTQYAGIAVGVGSSNRINFESVAGVDLRGLGIGTSLVLMNGRRLGLADFGRTADVSLIPVSAIERVEVLTDGASAIYGSDAVGGVINFVLRKEFEGAETRLSYGGVSSGNLRQGDFTQTFGRSWGSGHGLISLSAYSASELQIADRSYAAAVERGTLTPDEQRKNVLVTLSQDLTDRFTVDADVVLSRRDVEFSNSTVDANPLDSILTTRNVDTDQSFANLSLDYDFSPKLHGSFKTSYAETEVEYRSKNESYNAVPPTFTTGTPQDREYSALDLTAMLDGALFAFSGGEVRFSLGAGLLDEESNAGSIGFGVTDGTLSRRTGYAFGEVFVPLVGAGQSIPFVHRLELTVAGRYTRYEDQSRPALHQEFGDGTDPKIGLLWAPIEALKFRGTYGTAFRAPSMVDLDESNASFQIQEPIPIPFPTGPDSAVIIVTDRPASDLGPETATTYTVGFDLQPASHSGLRISGTYYSISYEDRIAIAPTGGAAFLFTPNLFPLTIYEPPSAAFIADLIGASNQFAGIPGDVNISNPSAAGQTLFNRPSVWVWDQRTRNLAVSEQKGFDFSIADSTDMEWGQLRYGANFTRILSYDQQASAGSVLVSAIDLATLPVSFRGRAHVGFSRGGFDGTLGANYVDSYSNWDTATGGAAEIDSWTTFDLSLAYDFAEAGSGVLDAMRLSLSVQNLFDEDPPFVADTTGGEGIFKPVGFDPTNANPLGRIVVLGVSKRW